MRVHDRFISVNSLRLHYREWGDSAAPAVILLHGGCAHAHWWDVFAAAIADEFRALALDLRGHGDSQHAVPPAYRVPDHVADVAALADALGVNRFDLVGHSLGGMVSAAYACAFPERINRLVVVDSQLRISAAGMRYMTRLGRFPRLEYADHDAAVRRFRLLPTQTNARPETLQHVATQAFRQLPSGRWVLKFDRESLAQPEPQDLVPALHVVTCPVLLVRGAHSTLLSRERLATLVAATPQGHGAEIPDAHHHVMLDNPHEFERVVRAFLCPAPHAEPGNP